MAKLTDTQLIMSNAAARDDGIAVVPPRMNKAAASKVGEDASRRCFDNVTTPFSVVSADAKRRLAARWIEASAGDGDAQRERRRDARRAYQSDWLAAAHDARRANRASQARVLNRTDARGGRNIDVPHRLRRQKAEQLVAIAGTATYPDGPMVDLARSHPAPRAPRSGRREVAQHAARDPDEPGTSTLDRGGLENSGFISRAAGRDCRAGDEAPSAFCRRSSYADERRYSLYAKLRIFAVPRRD
jgi:hypothetical protein